MAAVESSGSEAGGLNGSGVSMRCESASGEREERSKAIREVSGKIEGLNGILRRTADVIAAQG